MALSIAQRKYDMPHGALQKVARAEGVSNAYVTAVLHGSVVPKSDAAKKKVRRIQVALARKLCRRVDDVFPETEQETAPTPLARAS